MQSYTYDVSATIDQKVGVIGGSTTIRIDTNALCADVVKCLTILVKTHQNFPYAPSTAQVNAETRWIDIFALNWLIKKPNLHAIVFWQSVDEICDLKTIAETREVFPNCLSEEKKLDFLKLIIKKIWVECKK